MFIKGQAEWFFLLILIWFTSRNSVNEMFRWKEKTNINFHFIAFFELLGLLFQRLKLIELSVIYNMKNSYTELFMNSKTILKIIRNLRVYRRVHSRPPKAWLPLLNLHSAFNRVNLLELKRRGAQVWNLRLKDWPWLLILRTVYVLPSGLYMDCICTVYALSINCRCTVYALSTNCLSMNCLWNANELSMNCLWTVYALSMHCLWTVYELSMNCLWT